jgi:hypothetical protein
MHDLDEKGVPLPREEREKLRYDNLAAANHYGGLLRKLADMPTLLPSEVLQQIAAKVGWKTDPWGSVCDDALITLIEDLNSRGL